MPRPDEQYDDVLTETCQDWRGWLDRHHATAPGVWLVTSKKGSGGAASRTCRGTTSWKDCSAGRRWTMPKPSSCVAYVEQLAL